MLARDRTVFISYRRSGGDGYARTVQAYLESHGFEVFLDVDRVKSGPWEPQLIAQIKTSSAFVLICSPGCFDRCRDANDMVRREIDLAITSGKRIVPITLPGFLWPTPEELPPEISHIGSFQAFEYSHQHWAQTRERLVGMIEPAYDAEETPSEGEKLKGVRAKAKSSRQQKSQRTEQNDSYLESDEACAEDAPAHSETSAKNRRRPPVANRKGARVRNAKSGGQAAATISAWLGVTCILLALWALFKRDYPYTQVGLGLTSAATCLAIIGLIQALKTSRGFVRSILGAAGGALNLVAWLLLRP
jgi:hypothetical protein